MSCVPRLYIEGFVLYGPGKHPVYLGVIAGIGTGKAAATPSRISNSEP